MESHEIGVSDAFAEVLGNARFFSRTFRLFKLPAGRLETLCEDYGQAATYRGTLPGHAHCYRLDGHHLFPRGKPVLVCGNTAAMLQETWLAKHFSLLGDRSTHFGLFDCAASPAAKTETQATRAPGGCC